MDCSYSDRLPGCRRIACAPASAQIVFEMAERVQVSPPNVSKSTPNGGFNLGRPRAPSLTANSNSEGRRLNASRDPLQIESATLSAVGTSETGS
jgi:hypothetical protein